MWTHYFKVTLRNLRKRKGHAVINVLGLGVGLAVCLLSLTHARHELGYDSLHENGARVWSDVQWVQQQDRYYEEQVTYADPSWFEVFTFLAPGDPATALRDPYSAVRPPAMVERYFGAADPMGQVLRIDNRAAYTVRGALDPLPSSTVFDVFLLAIGYQSTRAAWADPVRSLRHE